MVYIPHNRKLDMTYNIKAVEQIQDKIMDKLTKAQQEELYGKLTKFSKFRGGEMTIDELDEMLLFTGNKVKEALYLFEEAMYKGQNVYFEKQGNNKTIRQLIDNTEKPLYNF
tara:strand:+ start:276 stop:611 length:336 start_codon:yes stop_codon:yes gene_type:complete